MNILEMAADPTSTLHSRLRSVALSIFRSGREPQETASDIVQDTLLSAIERGRSGETITRVWLTRRVRDIAVLYRRRNKTQSETFTHMSDLEVEVDDNDRLPAMSCSTGLTPGEDDSLDAILNVITTLPLLQQQVMSLVYRSGLDLAETAEAMGISHAYARQLSSRAIHTIKEKLGQKENVLSHKAA